ncbi:Hypothetical predicted protein [Olea europaea subsp. europaea]|uniref:Uncharacterized protein n=1 Tax=Olea europaea subsp. europaea TaxID=158383 RepID=A0A8S0SVW3_OLEEU|nr:Hypothetical predicted protein [Olea europaea subsp. europaea]
MEEGNVVRQSSLRPVGGALKSTLSGRSTPRGSPSFRRLNSSRTIRRDGKNGGSRWAHGNNKEGLFSGGYGGESSYGNLEAQLENRRDLIGNEGSWAAKLRNDTNQSSSKNLDVILTKKDNVASTNSIKSSKKKGKKSGRSSRKKTHSKPKVAVEVVDSGVDVQEEEIPRRKRTYGLLVGPFGSIEERILEWSPEKRSGTCDRKGAFVRLVGSRKFVLLFHELSMTGTPLAMMELPTEFLSCDATISVIVLNKKGGLMPELARRKIEVLEDKTDLSFKTAMKADLIIAGSAVLGTASEGTKEIVKHNVSGLLHPLGRPGARVLAKHLQFLLENVSVWQAMGTKGIEEVEKKYLKKHVYQKFGEVLYKSMRIK